jgi:hypothetical protein
MQITQPKKDLPNVHANATVTFDNANHTTKKWFTCTILSLKRFGPKITIGHPPLCKRELYYHGINNIITKQNS